MSVPLHEILLKLCRREDLTRSESREAFSFIMSGLATDAQIGGLLVGLAAKGSTVEELVGAAMVMREKAIPIPIPEGAGVRGQGSEGKTASSLTPDPYPLTPSSEVILDT